MPPRTPCHWTDASMPKSEQSIMDCVFENLWELSVFSEGEPVVCKFDSQGQQDFIRFHDVLSEELAKLTGNLAAAWSKYRGYAARLALLIQYTREAECGTLSQIDGIVIDSESMVAAIQLVRWFGRETKRIYHELEHAVGEDQVKAVLELIQELGGMASSREVMRRGPCIKSKAKVMRIFNQLELASYGKVISTHPSVNGGRPSIIFRLKNSLNDCYGDGD